MFNRFIGSFFVALVALIGAIPASAALDGAPRSTYFEQAATAMELHGDRDAARMLRSLGDASPTVPPVLSSNAVSANPEYAAKYRELQRRVRQAILRPAHAPEHQWRVDRTEADLHLVANELEQGSMANRPLVLRFLTDAAWALDHQIVPYAADALAAPTAAIWANPATINAGASSLVTWRTTDATGATINGNRVALNGEMTVTPSTTSRYNLDAVGEGGRATAATTVTVLPVQATAVGPTARIMANPSRIEVGQSSTVTWNTTNATSATINGDPVALNGSMVVRPAATTRYDLVATGDGGRALASTTVEVYSPSPTALISVSPRTITRGDCALLTWSSTNATNVTINGMTEPTSGSKEVCPTASQAYDMVATGPGGRAVASAALAVVAPAAPTANLSAYPNQIERGACTILRWETTNATKVMLDGKEVASSGSMEVCPTTTRTYELLATGPGGRATDAEIITVTVPAPAPAPLHLRIHFDFDESVIRPDAIDTMAIVARMMRDDPALRMRVEGHCDAKGSDEYNLALGERRAQSVRDYFVQRYGISPIRFDLISKGENEPIAANTLSNGNDNPAGRAMNRRAEFVPIR